MQCRLGAANPIKAAIKGANKLDSDRTTNTSHVS
jgi:hypothetical protein